MDASESWDEQQVSCYTQDTAPVKSGMGRGNLAKVFGEKLRGIGRGFSEVGQSNEFNGRRFAAENSANSSENGFRNESKGGFGGRTDEKSQRFCRENSGSSGFSNGRHDEDSSVEFGRMSSGFGSRKNESSNGGSTKKYDNSRGGFGEIHDDSVGFSNRNNSNFGGEDKSVAFSGRKDSSLSGGFGSRTDKGKFGNFSGDFGSSTDNGKGGSFSGGFRSRTAESRNSGKDHDDSVSKFGNSSSNFNGRSEDSENSRFGSRGGSSRRRGGGQQGRAGDWACSNASCGNLNFAFRQFCQKCETAKPDNGSSNGFQGYRTGRPDGGKNDRGGDWACPDDECGHKNFAYRTKCQKCETLKPETRNGLGNRERPGNRPGNSHQAAAPYIPPTPSDREEDIFGETVSKGINFDKYEDIPVEVSGRNPCGFINSYDEAGLFPTILENTRRAHYERPTPIQKYSIPAIMSGRDLMACAQTGSGKTAAFLLPVLTAMIKQSLTDSNPYAQAPKTVCIVPTRELAIQIHADCRKFTHRTDIKSVVVYGGASVGHQLRQLECGVDFVIGTPGRLLDFVNRGKLSLQNVSFLILDEADRMLDLGFEPDIRKLVETFGMPPKTQRQTLMFSATFPEKIQELAADFLNNYLFVTVGRVGGANTDVSQHFFEVPSHDKTKLLIDILSAEEGEKTLVFVNEKRFVDFLASYLCEMKITATSIHGDRLQREREEALSDFKSGKRRVLVATSVAARGLDIPEVMHVVNYDLPISVDEYVHRIGRTGRCGNLGKATSFFTSANQLIASDLVKILKEAHQTVPDWLAAYACDMKTDTERFTSSSGQFGGKDIRRNKFNRGGSRVENNASSNWMADAGGDCNAVDDESWD